jgi:tetratricopeptide (TPR) repeat protein
MLTDAQGLEVTTFSAEAIASVDRFVKQSLSYGDDTLVILKAIAADPTWAIAHAHAAANYLSWESTAGNNAAFPHLQAAKKYLEGANEREKFYVWAIDTWAKGDIEQAIAYHEKIAQKYPRDIASVQRGQYHYFYQGNKEKLLQIGEKVLPANRENHYLYGMIAFGLEQCHHLQAAETMGRKAVEMNRHDPWAHHAVAHVMEMQGRIDEGITWMESLADTWENCNSMLFTHNWWHIALYYLEKEEIEKVLKLYDSYVWGRASKESSKDQVGAIALLLRLELRGIDVDDRWHKLSTYITARIHEHALPFQDLHYIYTLARTGRTELVNEMLFSMQVYARKALPYLQKTWAEVAIPAARGMVAHATGEWESAITHIGVTLPRLHLIGGSHAQRDLFEQVYLDAWLRAQHNHEALRLLEKRAALGRYIPSIQDGLALTNQ